MLKLASALRSVPPKLGPRSSSWCIPNHQSISACSSVATATHVKDVETTVKEPITGADATKSKHSMVRLVFDSLTDLNDTPEEKVGSLLAYVVHDDVDLQRAKKTVDQLRLLVKEGKLEKKHYEQHPKYIKLCEIIRRKTYGNNKNSIQPKRDIQPNRVYEFRELEQSYSLVQTMPADQAVRILSGLAVKQKRDKPLLTAIATNIIRNSSKLRVKDIADVLYGAAILNFSDEMLLKEMCKVLQYSLDTVDKSTVIGSIVTSLGILRYRDTALLNIISEWFIKNQVVLRTQDLCALIMTLAVVGHNPVNSKVLFEELVATMKETDMTKSSEWLDVVWSLTLLDRATPAQLESVLNTRFVEKVTDDDKLASAKKQKLLNINAAAKYLIPNYKGQLLPADCKLNDTPMMKSKGKQEFVKSITDALANLFPSKNHFRTNVVTGTGFAIDVEFLLNEKCAPLRLDDETEHQDAIRIAIVAHHYHDFCMGEADLLGPAKLHERFLQAQGYRVLNISHKEYHPNDKLLTRITYINERIKSIVK